MKARERVGAWSSHGYAMAARGVAGVLVGAMVLGSAAAAASNKGPLYDKPVYFPGTKSYYELVASKPGHSLRGPGVPDIGWEAAQLVAQQRFHNGVRGRLAVVNSAALNNFLVTTFRPSMITWIGLRYWCSFNRLQWVTGEFHDRSAFANWDRVWARESTQPPSGSARPRCTGPSEYWPVHYWGVQFGGRWNANGHRKEGHAYFVEYVTGGP